MQLPLSKSDLLADTLPELHRLLLLGTVSMLSVFLSAVFFRVSFAQYFCLKLTVQHCSMVAAILVLVDDPVVSNLF